MTFPDQYVTIGDVKTRFWRVGQGGVPLVLLHGLGGTVEDWVGTIMPLARDREVIAFDLLGCGKTDKPADCTYGPDDMLAHAQGMVEALDLPLFDLDGWSLGGRIALQIAYARPEQVRRLVLTAPAGIGVDTIVTLNAPLPRLLNQIVTRPTASGLRVLRNATQSDNAWRLLKFAARRVSLITDGPSRHAFLRQLRGLVGTQGYLEGPRQALHAQLPQITTPSLAIWGEEDNFAPFAHAAQLTELMPDCRVHSLPDCGHAPHIEFPELYAQAMRGFLN
ncbi:alpha/beta hydrolase [Sulfitobacter sp. HNIBRBA2951]|uniref:alpha/beta fold hydrolase n=1 Tax=Sulfitobacter aquimarinus TaxID=3158557 RepID=UPI0032DF2644